MEEERDMAKNLAEALREVKAMREGRLPEPSWEEFEKEMTFWAEEAKHEATENSNWDVAV